MINGIKLGNAGHCEPFDYAQDKLREAILVVLGIASSRSLP
jgi:hypothetical protein